MYVQMDERTYILQPSLHTSVASGEQLWIEESACYVHLVVAKRFHQQLHVAVDHLRMKEEEEKEEERWGTLIAPARIHATFTWSFSQQ